MFELSKKLEFFVNFKISTDPYFKKLKVILSGVDVPGEGEHKIMEYIRWYKTECKEYDKCT